MKTVPAQNRRGHRSIKPSIAESPGPTGKGRRRRLGEGSSVRWDRLSQGTTAPNAPEGAAHLTYGSSEQAPQCSLLQLLPQRPLSHLPHLLLSRTCSKNPSQRVSLSCRQDAWGYFQSQAVTVSQPERPIQIPWYKPFFLE